MHTCTHVQVEDMLSGGTEDWEALEELFHRDDLDARARELQAMHCMTYHLCSDDRLALFLHEGHAFLT